MGSVRDMREENGPGREQAGADARTAAATAAAAGTAAGTAATGSKRAGGRRPGETRTRETILAAARACFAERGFDATSMRRIAEAAGVDQALVHHFYGTKESLFLQALELPGKMHEASPPPPGASARGSGNAWCAPISPCGTTCRRGRRS
ncbi:hypothetical protein GCM10020295_03980 [Streptomyces cinereospinus]